MSKIGRYELHYHPSESAYAEKARADIMSHHPEIGDIPIIYDNPEAGDAVLYTPDYDPENPDAWKGGE